MKPQRPQTVQPAGKYPNTGEPAIPGKYCIGPRRSISIFGGYPVRTILKPDGTPLITFQLMMDNEEAYNQVDNLVKLLNKE